MSLKNFILSKVFLKNLGLAISIVVGVIMILAYLDEFLYKTWTGPTGS